MKETVIINVEGLEVKTTRFRIEAIKIAKKHDISMFFCNEKRIEIAETDESKARKFVNEIADLGQEVKIVDLRRFNQHIDSKGYNIIGDKARYLVDDDYYRELIGEVTVEKTIEQVMMF